VRAFNLEKRTISIKLGRQARLLCDGQRHVGFWLGSIDNLRARRRSAKAGPERQ
jgi:hypothetical protein